jgi:hypothetical protein
MFRYSEYLKNISWETLNLWYVWCLFLQQDIGVFAIYKQLIQWLVQSREGLIVLDYRMYYTAKQNFVS